MRVVRSVAALLGELLITAGLVLLLFVGWQLWWTDVVSDADAGRAVASLQKDFSAAPASATPAPLGDAFAIARIPRFGADYARPLYEGTDRDTLQRGIGHYPGTAMPGEVGNFSMAGHRTTYGKPFNRIAELRAGDVIVIETRDTYFVYQVTEHLIVAPSHGAVLLPVPEQPGATPTQAALTMTSCHPEYSSRERYVVHALLAGTYSRAEGVPADVLKVS
jgi:sortase A